MNNTGHVFRKRGIFFTTILTIIVIGWVSSSMVMADGSQSWEVAINGIAESDGRTDTVYIGEDSASNDGPPADDNDVMKPPTPPAPYLYLSLDDGLPIPYHALLKDYREYPDTSKIWNLTVRRDSSGVSTVNLTWDSSGFVASEYDYVNLTYDSNGTFCANMLTQNIFSFSMTAPAAEKFKIVCEGDRTTGDDDDDSNDDDDNDSGGGSSLPPPPNHPPIANVSASDTSGFIDETINFDGSYSTDSDGSITNYTWDFGDGTAAYGKTTTHVFSNNGTYHVTLTVTDNNDATDQGTIDIVITSANNPPTKPNVTGPTTGHTNILYNFTAASIDADNDTIRYTFNWGDGKTNTTDFLPNGTATMQTHSWTTPGEYVISVEAYDAATESGAIKYTILIDVFLINDEIQGYLVDKNSDGTYDSFDNSDSGAQTDLKKQDNDTYLIDSDADGDWDYIYNLKTGLTAYQNEDNKGTPGFGVMSVIIAIGTALIILRKKK